LEEEEEEKKGRNVNDGKDEGVEKLWQECAMMEKLLKDKNSEISEKNNEVVKIESSPSSVKNDDLEHANHSSVTTSVPFEKKGYFEPMKGSTSNLNKVSEKSKSKSVGIINMQNVSGEDDVQVIGSSKLHKGETNNGDDDEEEEEKGWRKCDVVEEDEEGVLKKLWQECAMMEKELKIDPMKGSSFSSSNMNKTSKKCESKSTDLNMQNVCDDYDEGKQHGKGLAVRGVSLFQAKQENMWFANTQKMPENKVMDYKGRVNIWSGEKKTTMENNGLNRRVNSTLFMRKELRLAKLLADCYWGDKNDTTKNDSILLEIKDVAVDRRDTRPPPVCVETPSLIWSLKKVEKVEKTKEEEEQEMLWDEVDTSLRELEAESMVILLL
jgi:hypothetical protein